MCAFLRYNAYKMNTLFSIKFGKCGLLPATECPEFGTIGDCRTRLVRVFSRNSYSYECDTRTRRVHECTRSPKTRTSVIPAVAS